MSSDDAARLRSFRNDESVDFPILIDPDNRVSISYGLLNEDNPKVPHPTLVVVDIDGIIRYIRVDENYKVRPPVSEVLEAVPTE